MDKNDSNVLEITAEEQEAINRYQGSSTQINELLGNFISDDSINLYKYKNGRGEEVSPYYTEAKLNRVISDIENIYSAMVKTMMRDGMSIPSTLYRGGSSFMENGRRNTFTSTTTLNSEAAAFATSKSYFDESAKAYVEYIHLDGEIPYYVMERKGNENEILLSPFVIVESSGRTVGSWSGYSLNLDKAVLKKDTLQELSEDKIAELQSEILSRADEISLLINECLQHEQELQRIYLRTSQDYERYDAIRSKYSEKLKVVKDWKNKFELLMECRCSNIEKTLAMELEKEQHPVKADVKPVEKTPVQSAPEIVIPIVDNPTEKVSEAVVDKQAEKVSETIPESKKLIQSSRMQLAGILTEPMRLAILFRGTRVNYQSPCRNIEEQLNRFGNMQDVPLRDTVAIEKMNSYITQTGQSERSQMAEELSQLEQNEFKRAIAKSVARMRASQEKVHLISEEKKLQEERTGMFGILSGKEKEKQERLQQIRTQRTNIDGVLQSIKNNGLTMNRRYSVHDILADIQIIIKDESVSKEDREEALSYRAAIMSVYAQGVNQNKVKAIIQEREKILSGNDRADKFVQSVAPTLLKSFGENRREIKAEFVMRSLFDAVSNSRDYSNEKGNNNYSEK